MGGLTAAYFTSYLTPYWCLGIYSIFGFAIFVSAFAINPELEIESDLEYTAALGTDANGEPIRRSFCGEIKHNWKIVKNEFKLKEF